MHQNQTITPDFPAFPALILTDEAIAQAHESRVRSLDLRIGSLLSRAKRWPVEWTAAMAAEVQLLQQDLTRARADQEQHRNAAARHADTPAVTQGTAA